MQYHKATTLDNSHYHYVFLNRMPDNICNDTTWKNDNIGSTAF